MSGAQAVLLPVGLLLCATLLAMTLRGWRPELAICLSLAAGALVVVMLLGQITPLLAAARRLATVGGLSDAHLGVVLKGAGVCLVTQLAADTCRDAGETALAGKAELVGRVMLLLLTVPLFEEILALITGLLQGQAVTR